MTHDEIRAAIAASPALLALVRAPVPDTSALAQQLSIGRKTINSTKIGVADVLGTLAPNGGPWLDAMMAIGAQNANARWAMFLIQAGDLDVGHTATRTLASALGAAVGGSVEAGITTLLALAEAPYVVPEFDVRCAIYNDDGTVRSFE